MSCMSELLDAVVDHLDRGARSRPGQCGVQHGTPSTAAEISSSSGPSDWYDSAGPPGTAFNTLRRRRSGPTVAPLTHRFLAAHGVGGTTHCRRR